MNRAIKDAIVERYRDGYHEQLSPHL